MRTLWEEFEARTSENAKIARDLDRLECLTQLYLYSQQPDALTDPESFEADLISDIQHPLTVGILERIREYFVATDG